MNPHPKFVPCERASGLRLVQMSHPALKHNRQRVDYAEEEDVQNLHAAIFREEPDLRVSIRPFSLWVLVVCGLTIFLAGFFSARYGRNVPDTGPDRGNPPLSQANLQSLHTGAGSETALDKTVAHANAPAVVHVVIKNMKFDPPIMEVERGDMVEWKNEDITPHTATSTAFDSASIAPDKSWRHTFTEAGSFPYTCTFHPDMKAVVTVK